MLQYQEKNRQYYFLLLTYWIQNENKKINYWFLIDNFLEKDEETY